MKPDIRIILNLVNITLVSIIYYIASAYTAGSQNYQHISPYFALGFLIIAAYLLGSITRHYQLPAISGYLFAGILFGPPLLNFIPATDILRLELINSLALSFIAITAGGELRLASLKKHFSIIFRITCLHTLAMYTAVTAVFMILFHYTRIVTFPDTKSCLAFSLLLATLALANSPASVIAIINETRTHGIFADVILSVTMLKDMVVLILFGIVMSFAASLYAPGQSLSLPFLSKTLGHIALSGIAGILYGFLLIIFFKYIGRQLSIFIIVASYIAYEFAHVAELEHMFMCLVAGFTVQNLSRQGRNMITAIENSHLPIYVVFFSIAGAGLVFSHMTKYFVIIILFVALRVLLLKTSTALAAGRLPGYGSVKTHGWTGFVANAGLAVSMLIIIEKEFAGWGGVFKSIVLSAIAVNQIIGPVLFKWGIGKSASDIKS